MLFDVVVGIDAPHLVRTADEVDAQLGQDVRRIVQRLRQVVDAAPHQDIQRSRILGAGALDDPLGAFGWRTHAAGRRRNRALSRDCPQDRGAGTGRSAVFRFA